MLVLLSLRGPSHFANKMYPGMYHGQKHTSFGTDYVRNNILVLINIYFYAEYMK